MPEPVHDLSATRIGNTVELRYTLPTRSTDKLALHGTTLSTLFCRELDLQVCQAISSSRTVIPIDSNATNAGHHTVITWVDHLPSDLCHGPTLSLGYRVTVSNAIGHSVSNSTPAFTASGEPPAPIKNLSAEGSRLGIVLRWGFDPNEVGQVTFERQNLDSTPTSKPINSHKYTSAKPTVIQLATPPGDRTTNLLDTTAHPDIPYRYIATRRFKAQLGDRSIEVLSAPSTSIDITFHPIYPPLAPTGLTAAAFSSNDSTPAFAVDLIWQSVDEATPVTPLAGYNLYRESFDGTSHAFGPRVRLNAGTLTSPAFHDSTAAPHTRYRYSVTAFDAKGNESAATTTIVEPQPVS